MIVLEVDVCYGYLLATVTFNCGSNITSTHDGLINVQGFYYSLLGGAAAAVAWAVSITSALPGDTIELRGCSHETWGFKGPVAGTYYIHIKTTIQV
jgi:hypothetical protein